MNSNVIESLREIVGPGNISIALSDRAVYQDGHLPSAILGAGIPDVVVMPQTTEQVSQIVVLANKEKISIVPRGCGESQSGANMAHGGILLDMALMDNIIEINKENMVVVAEAGCSVYKIMRELDKYGLNFPLGPIFTCGPLLGSAVSTNATGDYLRLGRLGDNVVGLEVVLPTGEVTTLGTGAYPNGYGFYHRYVGGPDLIGLFVNAVGTMGVLTKVAVRVINKPNSIGYLTYGWRREQAEDLTSAMCDLQNNGIWDIHTWNEWAFFGPSASFSFLGEKVDVPEEAHFINIMVLDGYNIEERKVREAYFKEICEKHNGMDLGESTSEIMYGPPHYLAYSIPGMSCREARERGIEYLSTRSAAFYYYAPVAKFAEIYDLWENICRKYGYWNEKYIPAWLSWADRNSINPYPMIVAIPSLDPEEVKKFKAFWTEHCSKLIEKGCAMYAIGRAIPREALTNLGNGYEFLKTIKRAVDPNNIMNPGILF